MITVPFIAFAEAEAQAADAAAQIAETTSVMPEASADTAATDSVVNTPAPTSEQSTEAVQETATSTQSTAGVDELAGTVDPTEGGTESTPIPVEEATSTDAVTPETIPLPEPTPNLAPDQIPVEAHSDLTVVATGIKDEARELSNAELNALIEPDFVTQLSGKTIPTKVKVGESEAVTATADPVSGDLHLSGTCDDIYYVVLLYKNQTDYETDPGSYIVNRAYPCTNGAYTYTLDDIPPRVQNGTYYLLIGAQGEHGSWRPVTPLQEVSINRSH
jgi:hypothetical protein